jgi:hypothetical protein
MEAIVNFRQKRHPETVSGREGPQGRKKTMKNSLIAIAFAAVSLPMFAQSTPAQTPAQNPPAAEKPAKTKKSVKKNHKKAAKKDAGTTTPVQK